jgi:hypothetical protein
MKLLQTARKRLNPEESLLSAVRVFYFNVRIITQNTARQISKLSMDRDGILEQHVQERTSIVCKTLRSYLHFRAIAHHTARQQLSK